jgi:phytoene dehydrogenase-like protein
MHEKKYDVIVIGSGVGGIFSAAQLAHAGYSVLVVEHLPYLGGRFSTSDYKGFKCATGGVAVQVNGIIPKICEQIGANVEFRPAEKVASWIAGKFYEMPKSGAIRSLVSRVAADKQEAENVLGAIDRGLNWLAPPDTISFRDWLLQYTRNEKILGIFQTTITSLLTVNDHELPAGEYFRFIKAVAPVHFGYVPGGSVNLFTALADVIRNNGGDIWQGCPAKRILVSNNAAKGIVMEKSGKEVTIESRVVISNVGPVKTIELVGRENLDKQYVKQVSKSIIPTPLIWIQLASDRPLSEYSAIAVSCARRVNMIDTPTLECPELAPAGKHLTISGGATLSSTRPFDLKKEIELNIQDLRDILPGFDRHAQILLTSCFRKDWPAFRTMPGNPLPVRTPIVNLYNTGDATAPRGTAGSIGAAETARLIAEDVKERISPGDKVGWKPKSGKEGVK